MAEIKKKGKENKEKQIELFEKMLALAEKHELPVIVHSRKAMQDTYDIIKKISKKKFKEKELEELKTKLLNYNDLKLELINGLIPFLSEKTGRIPIILPIIMDIKNG